MSPMRARKISRLALKLGLPYRPLKRRWVRFVGSWLEFEKLEFEKVAGDA